MPDGNDSNGIHPNVEHGVLDFVGVGFGPSNLALAIAVRSTTTTLRSPDRSSPSSSRSSPNSAGTGEC